MIKGNHPIADIPIWVALPYLAPFKFIFKRVLGASAKIQPSSVDEEGQEKTRIHQLLAATTTFTKPSFVDDNLDFEEFDPYLLYGYGISAYFNFIKWLMFIFFFLSVLHLPAIIIFNESEGLNESNGGYYSMMSLGSMLQATPACFNAPLENDKIHLQCPGNKLYIDEVISVGLIPKAASQKDKCFFEADDECNIFIRKAALEKKVRDFKESYLEIPYISRRYIQQDMTRKCTGPGSLLVI